MMNVLAVIAVASLCDNPLPGYQQLITTEELRIWPTMQLGSTQPEKQTLVLTGALHLFKKKKKS